MTVLEYNDVIKKHVTVITGIFWNILYTEAVAQNCSVFFEISQNSRVSFLMKLQA